jgi:amino acid adenylation domain-containing protein
MDTEGPPAPPKDPALLLKLLREKRKPAAAPEGSGAAPRAVLPIPRAARGRPLPASYAQERLWLLDRFDPGGSTFNMPVPLRLRGRLDLDLLERALAAIEERHESLRTNFESREGEVFQVVHPPRFRLEQISLENEADQAAALRCQIDDAGRHAFDLERGPLFRGTLLRLAPAEHVLVLNLHHAIADGWSIGILFRELRHFLEASVPALAPLALQYADFAAWQRSEAWSADFGRQLAYWRERLAGAPAQLALPTDRPRPAATGTRTGKIGLRLEKETESALRALAGRLGCSLFMPLLAAFKILLARLAGQDDLTVGTPVAGRHRRELEDLIGIFLNTLVLRTKISPEASFREILLRVRETVLGATAHQDVPFERLLAELQPERQLNQTPLFQVFFNMANIPDLRFELPGLEVGFEAMPELGAKFDLNLYVLEEGQDLALSLVYNSDLFDQVRMFELMEQLESVLEQAAADPERPVVAFDLVTRKARGRLPDPRAPLPLDWPGSAARLFAARAAATPAAVAVEDAWGEVAYGELAARVRRLAGRLKAAGVAPGQVVAVWADRSAQLAEAILGILHRGAAFVVLDPAYPSARLADFVALASPAAMILTGRAPAPPPEAEAFLPGLRLVLSTTGGVQGGEEDGEPEENLPVAVGTGDLAYIAFTSGSTGRPKAIRGGQGSLTAFLPFVERRFGIGPGDRNSMLSALSHDPLHRDILYSLCLGMTVVAPDPEKLGSPGFLGRFAREKRITVLNLVPAMLQLLLAETAGEDAPLPDLRRVFTVGEVLKEADVRRLYAVAPEAVCFNLYGSTETQRAVSFLELPRSFVCDPESLEGPEPGSRGLQKAILPLGRGIDGVQLLVLGPRQALAGVGELGEIVFRSRHLALGYANEAETREKFLVNPFTGDPGDRLYRTGDLGRYLPGGSVEFAGRADLQVKIRGFRVELPEIEAALRRHPAIVEAVVLLRQDGGGRGEASGDARLVAYFTHREAAPSARELRELLKSVLPDYMVPAVFVPLEAFPTGRTGKIDRAALPAPQEEAPRGRRPPATPDQELLAAIFGRLLGREEIGLGDNFFELGGHSLLATLLLSRVRGAFGVSLPLRSIFERPTLETFAAHLAELRGGAEPERPPLLPRPAAFLRRAPLSFAQQRLWFLEQLEPGSNAYLIFGALRLAGQLDAAALGRALGRLAGRHEALRTRIVTDSGEGFQEIADGPAAAEELLALRDFSHLDQADAETAALERAGELAARAIPLGAPRLWRAELLRIAEERHLFALAIHHLVADGWSLGIFLRELGALYGEELGGAAAELAPLPLQPADFAVWENDWLRGEALESQLGFWRRHLAGAPAALELPADFPRPKVPSYRGRRHHFEIPAELAGALRLFAREQNATLFMVLLAGFDLLLARLSGQETVVVGTPVAHRERAELEGQIGFFANTLPLRLDVDREADFAGLVASLRSGLLDAFGHQDLPFEKLVAELGVARDLARAPIFQAFFGLQAVAAEGASWGDARLSPAEVPLGRAQFDLAWTAVDPGAGALGGFFEYSSDLFAPATVEAFGRQLVQLFALVMADPRQPVAEIDLRLPEDNALAAARNATGRAFELELAIHQLVAANACRLPERVALGLEGQPAFTYGELDAAAERLAARLRRLGVGPEVVVGLAIGRLPSLALAQLAIWKAGGAYLPLDPIYPAERLAFMLEDAGARLLLVDSRGEAAPPELLAKAPAVLDLGQLEEEEDGPSAPAAPPAGGKQALAYVLYTSGSTGKPKGVMIEHGALVNFLLSMQEKPGLAAGDRLLSLTTMSFDIAGLEIWLPLLAGARVDLARRETVQDGAAIAAAIETCETTLLQATPATWRLLLDSGWMGRPGLKALCGGEALTGELAARLIERGLALWNVYGPTETTIWSAVRQVLPGEQPASVPLGAPIANTTLRIAERSGREAPLGVAGELLIGGAGLARGYRGRPALTAERFVPDPDAASPGARRYRTGDRARLRRDGELEFLGRLDFQVKVRGFRIELGEIEAVLARQPGVGTCLVAAREAAAGELQLVAYFVPEDGGSPPAAGELRSALAASLPTYMVPAFFVPLAAFPLTPTGKIDRRALPPPEAPADSFEAPQGPAEEELAALWAGLLGRERVGARDDFFALGGHSLLATRLLARVREAFGVALPLRTLFEAPTVAGLARAISAAGPGAPSRPPLGPSPRPADGVLPLSFAQQRLWFLDQLEPESTAYLLAGAVALHGPLEPAVLESALARLMERHEALRTVIETRDGGGWQRVLPAAAPPLEATDLRRLPAEGREAAAREIAQQEVLTPLPLTSGLLWRVRLLRLRDELSWLVLGIHHIVADGWSIGILLRELGQLYAAARRGEAIALPPLPVQPADVALWERSWLTGAESEKQVGFWRDALAGAPHALELPTDFPRPARQTFRGDRLPFRVPAELAAVLRRLGRERNGTLFMVLLAAYQVLLARLAGQQAVVVGTPVAHRELVELEGMIGYLANTLPLRLDVDQGESFATHLWRLRRATLDGFAHQDLPFEKLVGELAVERDLSRSPVFQAMFALQNLEPVAAGLGDELRLERVDLTLGRAQVELNWVLFEGPGGELEGTLEWNTDLFSTATVARLAERLLLLLGQVAADPERPVGVYDLETAADRQLRENLFSPPGPPAPLAPAAVAARAGERPEAIAVGFEGEPAYTYRELHAAAGRLARRLAELDAGPEQIVGLALGRGPGMVVAQLASWLAGAAYLPLDPIFPAERLEFMLEDSGAAILVFDSREDEAPPALLAKATVLVDLASWAAETAGVEEAEPWQPRPAGPRSLAYVLYTSGSTGKPKGVAIEHGSLANFLASMAECPGLGPADRLLSVTTFSFDIAGLEIWLPLFVGARVDLIRREKAQDPGQLAAALEKTGATVLQATPATWRLLADHGFAGWPGLKGICGGEALPGELVGRLEGKLGSLWNVYGPTETTIWSTVGRVLPRPDLADDLPATVPLGRPIAATAIQLADSDFRPVPPGVAGQLLIGGAGLARGYLDRPALTADRFRPDPFAKEPGARLYQTGDLARLRLDGELEFLGRIDFQVKLRGFRIELGEIEAVLREHPAVAQAVVVARQDGPAGPRLVGYFRAAQNEAPASAELQELLRRRLPDYMVPAVFVRVEAFPLTPNLKIDRRALPAPEVEASSFEPPQGPAEEELAAIWAGLLGRERIGAGDDFFALGGHSLLATRLLARVRDAFGVVLPVRTVFEAPTVAGLARAILAAGPGAPARPPLRPAPRPADGVLPLSFAQQRLWFLDQLEPASTAYLLTGAVALHGPLDPAAFEKALARLAARHEALRTRIETRDGEGWQVVLPDAPPPLEIKDLRQLPAEEREPAARAIAQKEVLAPLPLGGGSLWRVRLLLLGDELAWLVLGIHHIVSDGWSIGILLRELGQLYAAARRGEAIALPPLPVQPADVALWERSWLAGTEIEKQVGFWREALAGAPQALELPTDYPRPASQTFRGDRLPFKVPAALAGELRRLGRERGATLYMVLLTAYQVLLARLAGQHAVVVGTPVAHRELVELEGMIGFLANTLPLRLDIDREESFAGHLLRLRRATLDGFAHQDLPFEKLLGEIAVERDLARSPVFQAMFALQNLEPVAAGLGEDLRLERVDLTLGRAQVELNWVLFEGPEGQLEGVLEWNTDLFSAATALRLAERLLLLLEQIAADPERPVGAYDLETAADRRLRATLVAPPGPPAPLAPAAIAANIEARPEAVAVGLEGADVFTYRQLYSDAGLVARRLAGLGAGSEQIVGLALGRNPGMVLCQLATWLAGAAYLPLDPSFPADRLEFMFEDSGAAILVYDSREGEAPPSLLAKAKAVVDLAEVLVQNSATEAWQPRPLGPHSLAYVLYTSGSTGKPKGVLIEHGSLANFLASMARRPGLEPSDRLFSVTTFSFDIAGLEIWLPLTVGARVDLARRGTTQDADMLAAALEKCSATIMQATPATWRLLLDGGFAGRPDLKAICGGEALLLELAERLGAKVGQLWNVYGPTETTIWSTAGEVTASEGIVGNKAATLGSPIESTSIHILDPEGRPAPPGVAGQLCIGGAGLARGYHRRPALTADRFRPDPFAKEPGARIYQTGDLARLRLDGELEYLGRLDFQVKVRGFRIELGEIEAALESHPAIAQAVVVARVEGNTRLVAYYREAEGRRPGAAELQEFLRRHLPDYMVPATFVALESFPLTPNNKVDRRALPAPEVQATASSRPPDTKSEKLLAAIWQEVLGVSGVGAESNFFALGGDSILVIRVVARARAEGLELKPAEFFTTPHLEALASQARELALAVPAAVNASHQGIELVGDLSAEDLEDLLG